MLFFLKCCSGRKKLQKVASDFMSKTVSGHPVHSLATKIGPDLSNAFLGHFCAWEEKNRKKCAQNGCHAHPYSNDTEEAEVVREIEKKLNNVPSKSSDYNIDRVPELMFKENPEAYIPHMVSIGPIHHNRKQLQSMETRKMQYFQYFLRRRSPGKLKKYVKVVTDLEERAYRCYPDVKIKRKNFVMMMVVDGCFILELLHRVVYDEYSIDEASWFTYAMLDLILVENQLPFFVLEELYRVFIGDSYGAADTCILFQRFIRDSFISRVVSFLMDIDITTSNAFDERPLTGKPKHLLAFVRKFLIPWLPIESQQMQRNKKQNLVVRATRCLIYRASACILPLSCGNEDEEFGAPSLCARDLKNANVKFEKKRGATSLLDINFDNAKGILTIPPIIVQESTELILGNLIAYEFYSDDYNYVADYVFFLNKLINSGEDVELLQESKIFFSTVAHPSDVAKLFYSLSKVIHVQNECTDMVSRNLVEYYNKRWNKWKASLMLNYFNTPWALLSVVTAIILLVLTFTQTMYAALSYH